MRGYKKTDLNRVVLFHNKKTIALVDESVLLDSMCDNFKYLVKEISKLDVVYCEKLLNRTGQYTPLTEEEINLVKEKYPEEIKQFCGE